MTLKELVSRYVRKTEKVFPKIEITQGSMAIKKKGSGSSLKPLGVIWKTPKSAYAIFSLSIAE